MRHPRRCIAALAAGLGLSLVLAACGSQLDPETVAAVNGASAGTGAALGSGDAAAVDAGTSVGTTGDAAAGDTGAAAGTTGGAGTATGAGGASTGTTGGGADKTQPKPAANVKPGSCDGFKNSTGITDSTITISNVSDLSGPVPGLFQSAQDALRAYVAYFNANDTICGRKLALKTYDSRTDAGADQQGYTSACSESFAAVGSMSAFDSGGAATAAKCAIPDIRASIVTKARWECATCFGTLSVNPNAFHNAIPTYLKKADPSGLKNAALLYLNAGAAAENAQVQHDAMTRAGMTFTVFRSIDVAEFNYSPYVQELKSKNVEVVQFIGAYQQAARLASAMNQQGYKPKVFILDPAAYDQKYVEAAGEGGEDTVFFVPIVPFEEANTSKEMQLYLTWLNQVKPGATPDFTGVFAWSAAKLFVEKAKALGGKLTRESLVQAVKSTKTWTGGGIHSAEPVGAKNTGDCYRWLRLKGGKFVAEGSRSYQCTGLTEAN